MAWSESDLKKHLTAEPPRSLYLIAGEEKYLVNRSAARLIKKAGGDAFPEFNLNEFGAGAGVDAIADAATALPFFAEHKCVSVSDLDIEELNAVELKKLYELLESVPETTSLVFWYPTLDFDGKRSAKWKKFMKELETRGGALVFCERRSQSELVRLAEREAEKAGAALSRQNAQRVVEYAGPDVTRILGEMEKLCAFALGSAAGEQQPEITAQMIETLVPKTTETTVFLMANALVAGNYEKAYSLLDALFAQGEEPIAILGALSASFVDMCRVRAALESGLPAAAAGEYGDYKGKEFRLRNAEKTARGMKPKTLYESMQLLLEADAALKGSRLSGRIILEELIAKLLLTASQAAGRERA